MNKTKTITIELSNGQPYEIKELDRVYIESKRIVWLGEKGETPSVTFHAQCYYLNLYEQRVALKNSDVVNNGRLLYHPLMGGVQPGVKILEAVTRSEP